VVNGKARRGTGASEPIVVNQGDNVEITLTNGGSKAMNVTMPHSIDFHPTEVAPNKYPGVVMYHCATQPVLTHVTLGDVWVKTPTPTAKARQGHVQRHQHRRDDAPIRDRRRSADDGRSRARRRGDREGRVVPDQ
jgi:hypothetical protein